MKQTLLVLLFFELFVSLSYSQGINFEPNRSLFSPLLADAKEPRVAALINHNNDLLSLDIGVSLDLLQADFHSNMFGIGVDFGTFSELRRAPFFKFPVNSADYIFGINGSFKTTVADNIDISSRLRVSHISAHLVDGQFVNGAWLDDLLPFTYSREFIAIQFALSSTYGRVYLGYEYLFNTIPRDISSSSFQSGIELYYPIFPLNNFNPFVAIDFRLVPIWRAAVNKTEGYGGATVMQLGIKTNAFGKRGVRVVFNHYGGLEFRGMYLGRYRNEQSIGFLIDF